MRRIQVGRDGQKALQRGNNAMKIREEGKTIRGTSKSGVGLEGRRFRGISSWQSKLLIQTDASNEKLVFSSCGDGELLNTVEQGCALIGLSLDYRWERERLNVEKPLRKYQEITLTHSQDRERVRGGKAGSENRKLFQLLFHSYSKKCEIPGAQLKAQRSLKERLTYLTT